MIHLTSSGDYRKATRYLEKLKETVKIGILDKYGRKGVKELERATPRDTGLTASSWEYEIEHRKDGVSLRFYNTNIQNGCPIAIILQYGHGTRNGGYVEGRDYINPAIQPVFDELAEELWKEVRSL